MKITFDIVKIQIIKGFGADKIMLETTHNSPYVEEFCNTPLHIEFDATKDTGEDYVKQNFRGIPVEVIERPNHTYEFKRIKGRKTT